MQTTLTHVDNVRTGDVLMFADQMDKVLCVSRIDERYYRVTTERTVRQPGETVYQQYIRTLLEGDDAHFYCGPDSKHTVVSTNHALVTA